MNTHNEPRPCENFEETLQNRKAAMEMVREAAIKGDGICGALFELESAAHAAGLGFVATTMQDYADDDDIRPY